MERGGTVSGTDFAPLSSLLADTIDDAHNVARGLCPLEPDPEALAPALHALTNRMHELAAVRCECMTAGDVRVADPEMAQHLYRIAQEALSNAARHAKASHSVEYPALVPISIHLPSGAAAASKAINLPTSAGI